jgi:hypothetical protein
MGTGCGGMGLPGAPPSSGSDNENNYKYPVTDEGGEEDAASQSSSYHPIAATMQHQQQQQLHHNASQQQQHQKELNSLENLGQGQTQYPEMTSYSQSDANVGSNEALGSSYNPSNSQGNCIHFELISKARTKRL